MRHLDVEDRVLLGLTLGEIYVEDELRVAATHQEKVAGRVHSRLLEQVAERDEVTGALREPHFLTAAHHAHQLQQVGVKEIGGIAQRLHRGAHAGDIAVMIGAPHVDGGAEAALVLVAMIRDVGEKVRVRAVALHQHAILVVPELGSAQPARAVLLVQHAAALELGEGLVDEPLLVQRGLIEEHREAHAELAQVFVLFAALRQHADDPAAP